MCFINEGRDINEVEQEAIKDVIFFFFLDGWIFSNDGDNLLFPCAEILLFFYIQLEAQKLKDTFDKRPAADGYVRLDLLIAAGTESVNIKLMGGTL